MPVLDNFAEYRALLDSIPREEWRKPMTASRMDKFLTIDGGLASSFVATRARKGRPVRVFGTIVGTRAGPHIISKQYRILDVLAAAKADGHSVKRDRNTQVRVDYDAINDALLKAKKELADCERQLAQSKQLAAVLETPGLMRVASEVGIANETQIIAAARSFENQSGIYFLVKADKVVYVGQSVNVPARVATHRSQGVKDFDAAAFIPAPKSKLDALETLYIALFQCEANRFSNGLRAGQLCTPLPVEHVLHGRFS